MKKMWRICWQKMKQWWRKLTHWFKGRSVRTEDFEWYCPIPSMAWGNGALALN